jgi:hypothetical protein
MGTKDISSVFFGKVGCVAYLPYFHEEDRLTGGSPQNSYLIMPFNILFVLGRDRQVVVIFLEKNYEVNSRLR